jgi:hypothetical protein
MLVPTVSVGIVFDARCPIVVVKPGGGLTGYQSGSVRARSTGGGRGPSLGFVVCSRSFGSMIMAFKPDDARSALIRKGSSV